MADAGATKRDLYEVLGVSRDADETALRLAYRKLARRYHPDVNPGDAQAEERFKEISLAYEVLSNPEKRRNFDEFGHISLEGGFDAEAARRARDAFGVRFGGPAGPGGIRSGGEEFHFSNLDDLFGDLLGTAGSRRRGRVRGADLEAQLVLDFLEAARGGEHRVAVTRPDAQGLPTQETLAVRVPSGVADGGRIRLAGKGMPGRGGAAPGDLYATIRVRPHPVFRREGRDVYLDTPVSVREATLGARIEVPTLEPFP